jgi:hypothetical protein
VEKYGANITETAVKLKKNHEFPHEFQLEPERNYETIKFEDD